MQSLLKETEGWILSDCKEPAEVVLLSEWATASEEASQRKVAS